MSKPGFYQKKPKPSVHRSDPFFPCRHITYHFWILSFSGRVPNCAAANFLRSPIVSSSLHLTRTFFPSLWCNECKVLVLPSQRALFAMQTSNHPTVPSIFVSSTRTYHLIQLQSFRWRYQYPRSPSQLLDGLYLRKETASRDSTTI